MIAFRATEEPYLAFISRPELAEPPERQIVAALRALDLNRGHGLDLVVLIVHDRDLVLRAFPLFLHLVVALDLPDIPALPALQLPAG